MSSPTFVLQLRGRRVWKAIVARRSRGPQPMAPCRLRSGVWFGYAPCSAARPQPEEFAIYLKYGAYPFDPNATLATTLEFLQNKAEQIYGTRQGMEVSGFLFGVSQADLSAKALALQAALAIPFQELDPVHLRGPAHANAAERTLDLGRGGSCAVPSSARPRAGVCHDPQLHLLRRGGISPATCRLPSSDFSASLSFWGGGRRTSSSRRGNGPPQKQSSYPQTESLLQQGSRATAATPCPCPPSSPAT